MNKLVIDENLPSGKRKSLRPYQDALIINLFEAIAAHFLRVMLMAPTGAGKTIVAAEIVSRLVALGPRVIFTVPSITLIDQTVQRFRDCGITSIGVIQADHPLTNPDARVQIASVQTLLHRPAPPPADFVLIDEAHVWFEFYEKWMAMRGWRSVVPFVGLSATPWTRGLGLHYDKLIVATTTAELIEQGYLTKFRPFAPSSPDLTGVRILAGDYHEGDLAGVMNNKAIVGDVVGEWIKRAEGRPTICYAVNRAHARHLTDRFIESGVSAAYMDGTTSLDEREEIRRAFHTGEINVVCNVGVLTTGVDWDVRCIILARPTKSEILFTQIIGRGLRPADGKQDLLILDHAGNHGRLGFVTDIHHEVLDDGAPKAKKPREKLPNECSRCSYVKPQHVLKCPSCGFMPPQQIPKAVAGRLVEIQRPRQDETKAKFYQELKAHALFKGFQLGWVGHKFKDRFGHWPPASFSALSAIEPSLATRTCCGSRPVCGRSRGLYRDRDHVRI